MAHHLSGKPKIKTSLIIIYYYCYTPVFLLAQDQLNIVIFVIQRSKRETGRIMSF